MICKICGKESKEFSGGCCSMSCFTIDFWNRIVAEKEDHLIINGQCYAVGPENVPYSCRGFGGAEFTIEITAKGEVIETNNLWFQGDVPKNFREKLPNTAKFIKRGAACAN